ncbi:MAG: PHP domain-containing protein [archaeon]|jgi:hypothetical protein|nr:PHP domain-containing protein [archaeon]
MRNSDLHVHSYYSDGELSPKQVIQLAKKRGLKFLALTDHNSFSGVQEAVREGRRIGVNVIPAIEIATKENEILAYFVDSNNRALNNAVNSFNRTTNSRIMDICKQLNKQGYKVSYSDLERRFPHARGNYNYLHISNVLLDRGYISTLFEVIGLVKEKVPKKKKVEENSTIKIIKLVRAAGGVPVLSHPWVSDESRDLLRDRVMKKLVKAGLCGLELDNGDKPPFKRPYVVKKIKKLARRYNLVLTSGSDFHGPVMTKFSKTHYLGKPGCDESVVYELLKRKLCK